MILKTKKEEPAKGPLNFHDEDLMLSKDFEPNLNYPFFLFLEWAIRES